MPRRLFIWGSPQSSSRRPNDQPCAAVLYLLLCFVFCALRAQKRNTDKMASTMLPQAKRRLRAALRKSCHTDRGIGMNLTGRSAIITGANQGLGRAIATHFVQAGANVLLVARGEELLREAQAELAALATQPG